jgi:tRNA threonylcarbamoyladenosine modification (KEOPS) complex Cgi121 subunit
MSPVPPEATRSLLVTGARRATEGTPTSEQLVSRLRAESTSSPSLVALFDAEGIGGERHLLSAWAHLGRSRSRGESRLRDRGAELALYVSGEEQFPRALARIGIGPTTQQFVLVAERPRELAPLLERFGLVADPTAYPRAVSQKTLERLGITAAEFTHVDPERWEGLVLERVAFVDLVPARAPGGEAKTGSKAPG